MSHKKYIKRKNSLLVNWTNSLEEPEEDLKAADHILHRNVENLKGRPNIAKDPEKGHCNCIFVKYGTYFNYWNNVCFLSYISSFLIMYVSILEPNLTSIKTKFIYYINPYYVT